MLLKSRNLVAFAILGCGGWLAYQYAAGALPAPTPLQEGAAHITVIVEPSLGIHPAIEVEYRATNSRCATVPRVFGVVPLTDKPVLHQRAAVYLPAEVAQPGRFGFEIPNKPYLGLCDWKQSSMRVISAPPSSLEPQASLSPMRLTPPLRSAEYKCRLTSTMPKKNWYCSAPSVAVSSDSLVFTLAPAN